MNRRSVAVSLIICFFAVVIPAAAQTSFTQLPFYHTVSHYVEQGSEAREHQIDIERMIIDVRFVPEEGKVIGKVTHIAVPLRDKVDSIVFDAIRINVKKAFLGYHL